MNTNRFRLSRPEESKNLNDQNVLIGEAFAFLDENALKSSSMRWLFKLMGKKPSGKPQIVSLVGPESVDLFGYTIEPLSVKPLLLQCIVSDKSLYRSEKDTINLLVLKPLAPNSSTEVIVNSSGNPFSKHTVELGHNGEGMLTLTDLPVGEYTVQFETIAQTACEFIVAEYRLAPLVSSLVESKVLDNSKLKVTLQVESFGVPLNEQVRLSLMDRTMLIAMELRTAVDGKVEATFELTGEGPHSIYVQVPSEPSKTATVPLRGSRESERKTTLFSPLGTEVVGSLLPIGSSEAVRGIYFSEGAIKTSPISLAQVDSDQIHLNINSAASLLKVVVVDPTFPRADEGAVEVEQVAHPSGDAAYKTAEAMFKSGNFLGAAETFWQRRAEIANPHPYFAYYTACSYARAGQRDKAVQALRQSFMDGWREMQHLEEDEDLSSLRDFPPFEHLLTGGLREFSFEDLEPGRKISLEAFSPSSLVLLGAYIDGKAWEGWATVVAPSTVSTEITLPQSCPPGKDITIEFSAGKTTSIYAIVKDARLISADTPELKLAGALKTFVELEGKEKKVGEVKTSLRQKYQDSAPPRYALMARAAMGEMTTGAWGALPMAAPGSAYGGGFPDAVAGSSAENEGALRFRSESRWDTPIQERGEPTISARFGMAQSPDIVPHQMQDSNMDMIFDHVMTAEVEADSGSAVGQATNTSKAKTQDKAKSITMLQDDPEVVFAGFVKIDGGRGRLTIKLPDSFADYIVECFAVEGLDWASRETRFRAAKDPFVKLTTPVFTRKDEPAQAFVHIGSTEKVKLKVLLNGEPIEVFEDGNKPFTGEISGAPTAFSFSALPGAYEAIVEDSSGETVANDMKNVDEPGKLRRLIRTIQILQSGETVALTDDSKRRALTLMPGLDTSFKALVEATADYAHCCCEQTAAKILSGCAMYMFAGGDDNRRKTAETVILAGIRREQKMWLKGRGFKAYPERFNEPDQHYGRKAARYLWNLQLLKDADGGAMSKDLKEAIEIGLEMAADTSKAYKINWPPSEFNSCEDAYGAINFGKGDGAVRALKYVEETLQKGQVPVENNPWFGYNVFKRAESAYAAAVLLNSRNSAHLKTALALANEVISQLNDEGRLYSTYDSVAAIALMKELDKCGITGGDTQNAKFEFNGEVRSRAEALNSSEKLTTLRVLEGVATVMIDTMVEEDWTKFASDVPLRVSLEKGGQHGRKFKAGDSFDLIVALEDGYKMGDLLWVALPDAVSRVVGGGQVKLFSIDFAGQSEVRISLAATGVTEVAGSKTQSIAVCVRNMFIEERVGNPGLIQVTVTK